jgi:hypothetical protein
MRVGLVVAVLLTVTIVPVVPAEPAGRAATKAFEGVSLAGHRAVYELAMLRSDPSLSIDVRGRLALEFKDVCDGFTLTQRLQTETTGPDGGAHESDYSITTWESKDGLRLRFNIRHVEEGEPPEEFTGTARIASPGDKGVATFKKPPDLKVDLPAGMVFPSEHLAILIRAARGGDRFVAVKVFDGSGEDGMYEVGNSIGRLLDTGTLKDRKLEPLAGLKAWPVRLAYFQLGKSAERPQYETGFRLFENGISDELVLDYGDYALKGTMTALDLFPKPAC